MRSSRLAVAALFAMTGCIIHTDGGDKTPPPTTSRYDITFFWSIGGQGVPRTCSQSPEVARIRVQLTGARGLETLENNGYYPCNFAGSDGVKLRSFLPGTYNYVIEALDRYDAALYTAVGSIHVNNHVSTHVTLSPNQGKMTMYWTFAGKACAQAGISGPEGVSELEISLNGGEPVVWPCSKNGVEGVAVDLDPGSYSVQIDGIIDVTGPGGSREKQTWYSATFNATVTAGQNREYEIDLDPIAAGATFIPKIVDRYGNRLSCAEAGIETLYIEITDWMGNRSPGFFDPCSNYETSGFHWPWLLAAEEYDPSVQAWVGTWNVYIEGWDKAGTHHQVVAATNYGGQPQPEFEVIAGLPDQKFQVSVKLW
jgi:hypothetical protein